MSTRHEESDALMAEVMVAIAHVPPDRVRVTGQGGLARQLRDRGLGAQTGEPLAIVETTGLGAELTAACGDVADGGLVVLAADAPAPIDVDLYRDVHRRGLVMVGISGQGAPTSPSEGSLAAGE